MLIKTHTVAPIYGKIIIYNKIRENENKDGGTLETLEQKIDRLNKELDEINVQESFSQDDTDRMNQLRNQISEAEYELSQQKQRAELDTQLTAIQAGAPVTDKQFEFTEVVDFEKEYGEKSINMWVQYLLDTQRSQLTHEMHTRYQSQLEAKDDEIKNGMLQITQFQETIRRQTEVIEQRDSEIINVRAERDDFEQKLQNAAATIQELEKVDKQKDAEIQRLKDREFDLQQQLANAPAPTASRIDITPDIEAIKRQRDQEKAKNTVYNKKAIPDPLDPSGRNPKNYTAILALTGETITFNWMAANNFPEIEEKDVLPFRAEHGATAEPAVYEPSSPVDQTGCETALPELAAPEIISPSFPSQTETEHGNTDGLQLGGDSTSAEDVGKATVTREEFEALKGRVDHLYREANISEVA